MNKNLFRKEALDNKKIAPLGSVFINTPVSYQILIISFILILGAVIWFIYTASYSDSCVVQGYIHSTKGVIPVFPHRNGIIVKSLVALGKQVKKGEVLFVIDTSYDGLGIQKQPDLIRLLMQRKNRVVQELRRKKIAFKALKPIFDKKFITRNEYNRAEEEIHTLENTLNVIEMEQVKYQQNLSYEISAPIDGTVSAIIYHQGQATNSNKPLIKIIPKDGSLAAELFVPISKAYFLKKDAPVLLRYDAYPYEHFGLFPATIELIHPSILTDQEEDKPLIIGEPYYKVIAALHSKKHISDGMTFSAVILGAKRSVKEWIFNPHIRSLEDPFA